MISPTDDETAKTVAFKNLMTENGQPLVFKHATQDWLPGKWTLHYLNTLLGEKHMNCKISAVQPEEFQWESECVHVQITMQQYIDWLYNTVDDDNPLKLFDRHKFSCYIDYKYMKDMFEDHPDVLKSVSWKPFGLDDRDGRDSTIWIGSQGAYTPCHQDTYGFNLVAQIQGRKRWYLFDPSQTGYMYPTRIPYEESSVYSEVNIRYPDLTRYPLFKKTMPFIVELVPGDVLYVPRHWWHFVESLEPTITINTWVPLAEDQQSRVEESISRLLFSSIASGVPTDFTLLNTGEELHDTSVNLVYVRTAVQDLTKSNVTQDREASTKQGQSHTDRCVDDYFNSFVNKFQDEQVIISANKYTALSNIVSVPGNDSESPRKKRRVDSRVSDGNSTLGSCGNTYPLNTDKSTDYNSEDLRKEHVQIYAIPVTQFEDFIHFLEETFNYETSDDDESECLNTLDTETSKLKPSGSFPSLPDIFNAILEPSVISHISSVLINRCKK